MKQELGNLMAEDPHQETINLLTYRLNAVITERDEWKAKFIQQNKDLGCEMMDPNGTIWDYAKKLQKDIAAINDRRDNFEERLRVELGGHPDSELWGDAGLIAATMRCVDALDEVTEQRDAARRLAEKYRNLSCQDQDEADATKLPWENNQPTEPESKDPHRFCRGGGGNNFHCGCKYDG